MQTYLKRFLIVVVVLTTVYNMTTSHSQSDMSSTSDIVPATSVLNALSTELGSDSQTKNEALIIQSTNDHIATIDQSNGTGNFAQITQSSATPSVAHITQVGSNNRAEIRQK